MSHEEKNASSPSERGLLQNDYLIKRVSDRFLATSVISMVFLYAGSLIDTLLVGYFLGENGLTAMSLLGPVYLIFYTVGATIGIGANTVANRVLGRGLFNEYRKIFTTATILLAAAAVVMTVTSYLLVNPIISLLAGSVSEEQAVLVKQYLLYYLPGGACNLLAYIPLYFLKTDGRPKMSSCLFSFNAMGNVLLSYYLMSPLCNMGIAGASLATSICMFFTMLAGFFCLLTGDKTELRFIKVKLKWKEIKNILLTGLPNGLSNLLESLRISLINGLLIGVGAIALLPCYTVVRNVMEFLSAVVIGLSSAMMPLMGVFYGERDYQGERAVLRFSKNRGTLVLFPLIVGVSVAAIPLCKAFGIMDSALLQEGQWAIPLACVGILFAYQNTLHTGYLSSIKREKFASVYTSLRTFGILFLFAIPMSHWLGSHGIWLSFTITEVVAFLIYYIYGFICRLKNKNLDSFLLDSSLEWDADQTFSIRNKEEDIAYASEQVSQFCEENDISIKQATKASLATEELLLILIKHGKAKEEQFVDLRICRIQDEVMLRFRYLDSTFDPVEFYKENQDNEEMQEELLGMKIILKSASLVDYRQTLGANNLMMFF